MDPNQPNLGQKASLRLATLITHNRGERIGKRVSQILTFFSSNCLDKLD